MNYAYFPTENIYFNGGFSAHHINRPKETFFNSSNTFDNRLPVRYIAFLNGSFKVNERLIVNPNVYYTMQARSSEIVGGVNAHYDVSGTGDVQFIAGLYYRSGDAIIPMAGLMWKNIRLSLTYDAATSSLSNFGARAYEFSLIKEGFYSDYSGNRRQSMCPSF
jgi:type IX secretion system PorP/SprF family membrane protein